MAISIISFLVTVGVFGQVGWIAGAQRESRSGVMTFTTLGFAAVAGFLFGGNIIVFGIQEFSMLLSWVSVSACFGAGLRLALTNRRLKQVENA